MTYNKPLPRMHSIKALAHLASPFPKKIKELIIIAEKHNLNKSTINLLLTFPINLILESPEDLITRSEELELLIKDEKRMPKEMLRSPEG